MPTPTDYKCTNCGGAWSKIWVYYSLGPTKWSEQRFDCPWCAIEFACPRNVDRHSWTDWRRAHDAEIALYPFLVRLAGEVEAMLNGRKQYTQVPIILRAVDCPKCQRAMTHDSALDAMMGCPSCGALAGKYYGPDSIDILVSDGHWPPIL